MSSIDDQSQSDNTKTNSARIDDKTHQTESQIVEQLRRRIAKKSSHSTPARRRYATSDSTAYQSVLTRLAQITSGADVDLAEAAELDETPATSVAQNIVARQIGKDETTRRHVDQTDKLSNLQTALRDAQDLTTSLQQQVQSLQAESSILVSRLGAENDARLHAEIEASQLASDVAAIRAETARLANAWQRTQELGQQRTESLQAESEQLQLAIHEKNHELSAVRGEYERRISDAARSEAQHTELRRALERRLERITAELESERAANESVGQEMQQLADEYSRQISNLARERNQLRTHVDELQKQHEQSRQRCAQLEEQIFAITKAQRETCRQNDARGMQVERLKVMLNETIAAEQDAKNQRASELSRMAQSKARWKLLLTQTRQKHREFQDQLQELIAKSAEEQSRREQAESNVARCQVAIELLNNRISCLKTLMQREVAAVRKREAALKRVVHDRTGQINAQEILSKVETDERVRRLTHELTLTRRLVLGLQQKCVEQNANGHAARLKPGENSSSKAAA